MHSALIQQALKPLVGLPLRCVGRAANLLWVHFGRMQEVADFVGETKTVGEWAIHVQCPWRLCQRGHIVLACRDYYYSPEGDALDDWGKPGDNRFDHVAERLNAEFEATEPRVLAHAADDVGGFSLTLSQDYRLDVFPARSRLNGRHEHWRLFEPWSEREHFVVPLIP